MRTKLVLAGLLAGAAFLPASSASASCVSVEGVDGCVSTCPSALYHDLDREAGGALPNLPGPLHFECTL